MRVPDYESMLCTCFERCLEVRNSFPRKIKDDKKVHFCLLHVTTLKALRPHPEKVQRTYCSNHAVIGIKMRLIEVNFRYSDISPLNLQQLKVLLAKLELRR